MMCMSFVMDGKRQENKRLLVKCKALKGVKVNSTLPKRLLWQVSMANGIIATSNWKHLPHPAREQPSWGEGPRCTLCHGLSLHNCF